MVKEKGSRFRRGFDYLECIDFESIQDRSTLGAGPLQQSAIRKQVRPVAERVAAMADALS